LSFFFLFPRFHNVVGYLDRHGLNEHGLSKLGFGRCACTFLHHPLGEKPGFSTMVSIMFQLHFEIENVTPNYFNSKWHFQLPTKIVDNVDLNPQHNQNLFTRVKFSTNIEVTRF
jgi:flagellar assembly factor FliW